MDSRRDKVLKESSARINIFPASRIILLSATVHVPSKKIKKVNVHLHEAVGFLKVRQ